MPFIDPFADISAGLNQAAGAATGAAGATGATGAGPTMTAACPPLSEVDLCFQGCHDKAKAKQEECKRITKEFVASMKANGCRGTFCRTGPVGKTCRNKKSYRRKCTKRKKKKPCRR